MNILLTLVDLPARQHIVRAAARGLADDSTGHMNCRSFITKPSSRSWRLLVAHSSVNAALLCRQDVNSPGLSKKPKANGLHGETAVGGQHFAGVGTRRSLKRGNAVDDWPPTAGQASRSPAAVLRGFTKQQLAGFGPQLVEGRQIHGLVQLISPRTSVRPRKKSAGVALVAAEAQS